MMNAVEHVAAHKIQKPESLGAMAIHSLRD